MASNLNASARNLLLSPLRRRNNAYYLAYAAFASDGSLTTTDASGPLGAATARTWSAAITGSGGAGSWTPTLGSELLVNGDFSAWTGDNPDGWAVAGETGPTRQVTEAAGACRFVTNADYVQISQSVLLPGSWYQFGVTVVAVVAGSLRLFIPAADAVYSAVGAKLRTNRSSGTGLTWARGDPGVPNDITFDDATCEQLTLSTILRTVDLGRANVDLSCTPTRTVGTQAGLVLNLDSTSSPANFVIVYNDGANSIKIDKCVGGTYTALATYGATYTAGRALRVTKSAANLYTVYYNGVSLGTQTISDAGIVSNTRHGLFSTYELNTFADFSAVGV